MFVEEIHMQIKFDKVCAALNIDEDNSRATSSSSQVKVIYDTVYKLVQEKGWCAVPSIMIALLDDAKRLVVPGALKYDVLSHTPPSVHHQAFMQFCLDDLKDNCRGKI